MSYSQDIKGCLSETIGDNGLTSDVLNQALGQTQGALEDIRSKYDDRSLPLLRLPEERDDLAECQRLAKFFSDQETTDVVVLGIGGSSLGAQALGQLAGFGTPVYAPAAGQPRLHFYDNIDPDTMTRALSSLDLRHTRFLVVSKSGSTAEPMMQLYNVASALKEAGAGEHLWKHFAAIAMPGDNPLRALAKTHELPIIDHDPAVGGRFSVLSNVGMVPALLMGLDPVKIREGAFSVLDPILKKKPPSEIAPAIGAALSMALQEQHGINMSVMMPYADRLKLLAFWYRQLWAESLGKNGKGTTPIDALGPVDQHSQLQLYLDGPNDKLVTIIMLSSAGQGPRVDPALVSDPSLAYLENKTIGDLVDAEQRATANTLIENHRPTRIMKIPTLDETSLGAIMMHFMLETIIAAHLWDVEPYDQPAVEEGKILARQYLGEL